MTISRRGAPAATMLGALALLCVFSVAAQPGAEASRTPAPAPVVTDDYLIGAGDLLQVFVWREEELSVTVPVLPDGKISVPLVGEVVAVGKTAAQLSRELERALAEFLRSPDVTVIVREFVGMTGAQIRVTGQALQPRSVPYRSGMTLLDVVIAVGGLTEFAAGNRSRLIRTVDGKRSEMRVKLHDLVNRGKIDEDIPVYPGDILVIPERVF